MFKRSLASCLAVATLTTAITTPANAYELTVEGETCTYQFNNKEKQFILEVNPEMNASFGTDTVLRSKASENAESSAYFVKQSRVDIPQLEQALKNPNISAEEKATVQARLKRANTMTKLYSLYENVFRDCANGTNRSEAEDKLKAALSSDDGKPNDAGIGLIVGGVILGVVGLIAAALPALAPMLPAQIRDMLHI